MAMIKVNTEGGTMSFSKILIGAYFTMKQGLLWRKVSATEAVNVWTGHIVQINLDVICHISN